MEAAIRTLIAGKLAGLGHMKPHKLASGLKRAAIQRRLGKCPLKFVAGVILCDLALLDTLIK